MNNPLVLSIGFRDNVSELLSDRNVQPVSQSKYFLSWKKKKQDLTWDT